MAGRPKADGPNIGLFATCLVDLMRPSVGFAAARLLEAAGCQVSVPASQTCCGQPAYNAGDSINAKAVARQVIVAFEKFDYVVAPSGSCAGMIRCHYPATMKHPLRRTEPIAIYWLTYQQQTTQPQYRWWLKAIRCMSI